MLAALAETSGAWLVWQGVREAEILLPGQRAAPAGLVDPAEHLLLHGKAPMVLMVFLEVVCEVAVAPAGWPSATTQVRPPPRRPALLETVIRQGVVR